MRIGHEMSSNGWFYKIRWAIRGAGPRVRNPLTSPPEHCETRPQQFSLLGNNLYSLVTLYYHPGDWVSYLSPPTTLVLFPRLLGRRPNNVDWGGTKDKRIGWWKGQTSHVRLIQKGWFNKSSGLTEIKELQTNSRDLSRDVSRYLRVLLSNADGLDLTIFIFKEL